jgi:hypothetical protein
MNLLKMRAPFANVSSHFSRISCCVGPYQDRPVGFGSVGKWHENKSETRETSATTTIGAKVRPLNRNITKVKVIATAANAGRLRQTGTNVVAIAMAITAVRLRRTRAITTAATRVDPGAKKRRNALRRLPLRRLLLKRPLLRRLLLKR